ncbi:MAG TPA: helix-turn-helix domain-containing protein, partial [Acidimicrobiia bacterium]
MALPTVPGEAAAVRDPLLGSVRNAARVLRAFSSADQDLGVTELAARLGLALYELGTNVTEHVDLHQAALPVLTTLRHNTGEMVHVAVLDGLEVIYVERLESHHLLPIFRTVGHRLP